MTSDQVERYLTRSRRLQHRNILRPMTGGELLDETLHLYRRIAASLIAPLALPALVMAAMQGFVGNYVIVGLFETQKPDSIRGQLGEFMTNAALGLFVAAPVWIVALSYASALTVRRASWTLLGSPDQPVRAAKDSLRAFPGLLRAMFSIVFLSLLGFIVSGGAIVFGAWLDTVTQDSSIVAGLVVLTGIIGVFGGIAWFLFVSGRYALTAPVAVIEDLKGKMLTSRAVGLAKKTGHHPSAGGTVLTLMVTSALLDMLISGSLGAIVELGQIPERIRAGIAGIVGEALAGGVTILPSIVSLLLVLPFFTIAITVLYFERRVRVEGYDISALANDIEPDRRPGAGDGPG